LIPGAGTLQAHVRFIERIEPRLASQDGACRFRRDLLLNPEKET
jgi:hypothetical protein